MAHWNTAARKGKPKTKESQTSMTLHQDIWMVLELLAPWCAVMESEEVSRDT